MDRGGSAASVIGSGRRRHGEQFTRMFEAGLAGSAGEQAVMADAMEAAWQHVEQETANELVRSKRHDPLPVGAVAAIVLVAEGDPGLVVGDEPPVRDGDTVGVAGEIGEHRLGAGERRLGVDNPALLPNWREVTQEGAPVGQMGHGSEEGEPPGFLQRDQAGEEQAAEQLAQDAHRQEEGWARRYPALPA